MADIERTSIPTFRIDYGNPSNPGRKQAQAFVNAIIDHFEKPSVFSHKFLNELAEINSDPIYGGRCTIIWDEATTEMQPHVFTGPAFPLEDVLERLPKDNPHCAEIKSFIEGNRVRLFNETITYLEENFGKQMLLTPAEMVVSMIGVACVRMASKSHVPPKEFINKIATALPHK